MIDKEKIKALREQRKDRIKEIQKMVKEQNKIKDSIKQLLQAGPKTPPEISESLGLPSPTIMWYVASLKKYGELMEMEKKGDYFSYGLIKPSNNTNQEKEGDER